MKRVAALVLGGSLLTLLVGTSVGAEGARDDGDGAAAPARPGAAPVRNVSAAAADLEKVLADLERRAHDAEQRFNDLGKRSDSAGARALVRGRAYARLARVGLLPVGGGFSSLVEHATRLERLRRGIETDMVEQKRATVERAKLARELGELKARIEPLQSEKQALARAETALLSAEDRERAFQRAFESGSAGDHAAVYGALGPADPLELSAGFRAARGRLPFPITGRAEVRSAKRAEGPGLEMRAPLGTQVRAIYPGRVAFADSYGEYDKTVIIDHGGRYYTVCANLGSIDVEVGDLVEVNSRIGTVGDVGRGALVYVEIRSGTETLDPAEWFGL